MSICYTGSNMLVCALSFDYQFSCVFYLNVFNFLMFFLFPLADSINFPSLLDRKNNTLGNKPIYGLDSHTSNQPALQPQAAT